ncbi:MAG: hypothetical protein GTO63_33520, partial [Anaerolineae bacterium]|nr:hypothetical protein [Anaerolineae bacterium]NIQ82419.1 hypothetical protein [Anaerolineae bacterium]
MVYRVRIMALAVLVSLGAQGCGRQEKESPPQEPTAKVRLSYMPSFTSDLAIFVAMEKGYFRDEGVE